MDPTPAITDEQLMAYADGELDTAMREVVEAALAADPTLVTRLAEHEALRERVRHAFAPELDEPVPARLREALKAEPRAPAPVVSLASHRKAAAARAGEASNEPRWGGPARWGAWAASLAAAVFIGHAYWPGGGVAPEGFALQDGGRLVARGAVETALNTQTAATRPLGADVGVPLSFVDRSGRYCRSFTTAAHAGLACREGGDWAMQMLVQAPATAATEGARQAASALPPALLAEIDQRIEGPALDAAAEQQAMQGGWRR
ncbi:anti-sigma factor family protein [Ideonella sp. YS5]|uniref:anti-sigma factor family protein n=1 Tax=Ideonella sp. YS5 TaxID=3453714 RepID=UPI003EEA624B